MPVYLMAQLNIHDRATYAKYGSAFMDVFNPYGGKLLSVEEEPEVLEGEWGYTRTVLLEFPSEELAHGARRSHCRAASGCRIPLPSRSPGRMLPTAPRQRCK